MPSGVPAVSAAHFLYPTMAENSMGKTQRDICEIHAMDRGRWMESG
jgi:hypothetical protein